MVCDRPLRLAQSRGPAWRTYENLILKKTRGGWEMAIIKQARRIAIRRDLAMASAVACGIFVGSVAHAAEGASPGEASASADTQNELTEITVTARRREESLEKVPVAVEVLTRDAMEEANVHSQEDLQRTVSGLVVRQSQNQNDETFAMRGATTDAF